jgi:hypothetical protein
MGKKGGKNNKAKAVPLEEFNKQLETKVVQR